MYHSLKTHHFREQLLLALYMILITVPAFTQIKSKKRGIAYGYNTEADLKAISENVSWWYNWGYQPESTVANVYQKYGIDFVPMTWNGSFNESGLRAFYTSHPDAKFLLGFNEPNFTTQSNMIPSKAAAIWPKLEKIAKDFGLKIVAPAVNYSDKPVVENGITYSDPIAYLDAFFAACPNCQVDYIAVHNYMCYSTALSGDIARYKKYKKPIWLTEFACWDQPSITLDLQKKYMAGAIDYLENDTTVFRYSWFNGNRSGSYPYLDLFKPQAGQLTDLGSFYVNFNPIHDAARFSALPSRIEAESYTTMSGIAIEPTKDTSGTADVSSIDANDWLEYNIDVTAAGNYNVFFRVASFAATSLELRENNATVQSVRVPSSGGPQNWKTLKTTVQLTSGKQKLQVFTKTGQFNLNWLEITTADQPTFIPEPAKANQRVYPNPVKDKLYIEAGDNTVKTEVSVLDISGRIMGTKIFFGGNSPMEIDFSNFNSGSYIVRIKNSGNISNQLIIK